MSGNLKLFFSAFFWLLLVAIGLTLIFTLPIAIAIEVLQNVIAHE